MAGVDGHAQAGQLVAVHLVAPALRQRLGQPHHLDAGLQGMVAGDQPDIAAAHDEQAPGGPHQVAVGQGLEGARPVHARQGVAREAERLLARPAGAHQHLRLDDDVLLPVFEDAHLAVAEDRQGGAVEPYLHSGQLAYPLCQDGGDIDAAPAGIHGVDRAKEAVGLQHQLAAQAVLIVDQQALHPGLAQLQGSRQPGRPPADDQRRHVQRHQPFQRAGDQTTSGILGSPSSGSTCIPGRTSAMQAFTGRPSASTRHCEHCPLAQ